MFESLSTKLGNVFGKLRGKGSLSENDVMSVAREIRVALLEADVALPVVKDFIEGIKKKAVGQDVIKGVNPFLATYVVLLALFVLFPQIVTLPVQWMR